MSSHDHMSGHHAPDFTQEPSPGLSDQMAAILDSAEHNAITGFETLIKRSPHRAMLVLLRIARAVHAAN